MSDFDGLVDFAGRAEIIRGDDQSLHAASRRGPQEVEELHTLAQSALHHFGTGDHFGDDGGDLRRTEIEFLVEILDRLEDLGVAEMRIVERRDLRAILRQRSISSLYSQPFSLACR